MRNDQPRFQFQGDENMLEIGYQSPSHFRMKALWKTMAGDQVLRLIALSLKQTIKGQDIVARYGGEEFAVVLPNTTLRQTFAVAENVRRAVMSRELKKKASGEILGRVTISVGVATLQSGDDVYALIERADPCLYAAKRNGRNRVVCETDDAFASSPQPASQLRSHST